MKYNSGYPITMQWYAIRQHLVKALMPSVRATFVSTTIPPRKIIKRFAEANKLNKDEAMYMQTLLNKYIDLALIEGEYNLFYTKE